MPSAERPHLPILRLWLLVALVTAMAALVLVHWLPAEPRYRHGIIAPWWLLAGGFVAAEVFPVHLDIRRNTWSATLSEIPLVIGLALSPSIHVVVGQILGCVIAWGVIRRQALHKLSFNTSIAALEVALAVVAYHLIAGNQSVLSPKTWLAAFAAMIIEGVVSSLGVAAAITALTGKLPTGVLENFFVSGVMASSCGTTLALCAAMVLRTQPWALGLLCITAVILALRLSPTVGHPAPLLRTATALQLHRSDAELDGPIKRHRSAARHHP